LFCSVLFVLGRLFLFRFFFLFHFISCFVSFVFFCCVSFFFVLFRLSSGRSFWRFFFIFPGSVRFVCLFRFVSLGTLVLPHFICFGLFVLLS
jgi:hypothetical protein